MSDPLMQQARQLRDEGMSQAALSNADLINNGVIEVLNFALNSNDGLVTIDDATPDLSVEMQNGGKWRGTIMRKLSHAGLIEKVGVRVSKRVCRHAGDVAVWRLVDYRGARAYLVGMKKIKPPVNDNASLFGGV